LRCGAIATRRRRARRIRCSPAYPYLGSDYALLERTPGEAPVAGRHPSVRHRIDPELRAVSSSIQCHDDGGAQSGGGRHARLFAGDLQRHWESLLAYDVKQVELDWSRMATG